MTAKDIPVGGRFTWAGHDTIYTVTHQVPGVCLETHLTYVRYFNPWDECEATAKWAGHTEVIAVPDTRPSGGTES